MTWGTSSGLLEHYIGTIEKSRFESNVEFLDNEGNPRIQLVWTIVNIENDEGVQVDEMKEFLGIGTGYEVVDNGTKVERRDGNDKHKFNKNTKYGRVINPIVKNEDGAFDGCLEVLTERGDPRDATVWEGLRFEFKRDTVKGGKDIGEYEVLVPVRFLGVDGGPEGKADASSNGKADTDNELVSKLLEIAKESDTFDQFVSQAMKVPGVTSDSKLLARLGDENDLYAKANS